MLALLEHRKSVPVTEREVFYLLIPSFANIV